VLVERWFVYVHDLGTVGVGAANRQTDIPLHLETDAGFVLRGRSFAVLQESESERGAGVSFSAVRSLATRFTGPDYNYRAKDLIPASFEPHPLATDGPFPYPVYPDIFYPAGSTINIDIQNNGASAAHFYALYHGVKLYGDGELAYTYPSACRMLDFSYTIPVPGLTVSESRTDQMKFIQHDADYVIRGAYVCAAQQPGQSTQGTFTNLFVTVKDHFQRAYSNAPVPINSIFDSASSVDPFRNAVPGLVVPEIYLPAKDWINMDFVRVDGAITGAHTVDLQVIFRGSKVYRA
jgi:hypothetical protein